MEGNNHMRERLRGYLNKRYGSLRKASLVTGIPGTTLSNVAGENKTNHMPGAELLHKLKLHDPSMDLNYIIAGEGQQVVEDRQPNYSLNEIDKLTKVLIQNNEKLVSAIEKCIELKSSVSSVKQEPNAPEGQ